MPALRILFKRVVPDLIKREISRERDGLGGGHPWLELANRHNRHSFQRTGDAVCVGGPAEPASNPESTTCGKKVLREEHPDTLISIANLVSTYRNQGRWKEAESLEVQVVEMRKRVVGEEHPGTLRIMGNLSTAYRNQGRWEEAEELEKQMMETNSRVVGEQYPVEVVVVHHARVITLLFQPSQVQRANKLTSCWLLASRSRT